MRVGIANIISSMTQGSRFILIPLALLFLLFLLFLCFLINYFSFFPLWDVKWKKNMGKKEIKKGE